MYSTKNIENILLSYLTRSQYNEWVGETIRTTGKSLRNIVNVRKGQAYQQIFGKQRRVWLPFDAINDNELKQQMQTDIMNKMSKSGYDDIQIKIRDIYSDYYLIKTKSYTTSRINTENILKTKSKQDILKMWIMGYIEDGNQKLKIGRVLNKMLEILNKQSFAEFLNDDKLRESMVYNITKLQEKFNNRYEDLKTWYPDNIIFAFNDKPDRYFICISRDPQDVGAMSTGQGWSSCQELGEKGDDYINFDDYNWHTKYDLIKGTCIAYLISEQQWKASQKNFISNRNDWKDENDNKMYFKESPLVGAVGRVLIKPFYNKNGQIYLYMGKYPKIYGDMIGAEQFLKTIENFLIEKQSNISGTFVLPDELYNETLGGKNAIEVKNGRVVGFSGYNNMLDKDPSNYDDREVEVLNELIEKISQSEDVPILYNTELGESVIENIPEVSVINSRLYDVGFNNINNVTIYTDDEYDYTQMFNSILTIMFNGDKSYPTKRYGYTNLNSDTLQDWLSWQNIDNNGRTFDKLKGRIYECDISTCSFDNCQNVDINDMIESMQYTEFYNCGVNFYTTLPIDNLCNDTKFKKCNITIYTENANYLVDDEGYNTFRDTSITFEDDSLSSEYVFYRDEFKDCNIIIKDIDNSDNLIFRDCEIDGESLPGEWKLKDGIDLSKPIKLTEEVLEEY